MGAAQHHLVQLSLIGGEQLPQKGFRFRGIRLPPLHQFHQPRCGNFIDPAALVVAVHQRFKFFLPQGHGRGHHADAAAVIPVVGQLEGRLDADDDGIRIGFPQVVNGGGGRGVAGHHQRLDSARHQPPRRGKGERFHLVLGFCAVGGVGGVAEIEIPFPGHEAPQVPQYTDAAHAGVEDGDIILFGVHGFT